MHYCPVFAGTKLTKNETQMETQKDTAIRCKELQTSFVFFLGMRNSRVLRNTGNWLVLFAICLPDVKDTDARNHEKATYYPDYAIYHDVDRYNR